jgi:hypothetical protein
MPYALALLPVAVATGSEHDRGAPSLSPRAERWLRDHHGLRRARVLNIDDDEIDDDLGGSSFDLRTEQHIVELGIRFGPAGS